MKKNKEKVTLRDLLKTVNTFIANDPEVKSGKKTICITAPKLKQILLLAIEQEELQEAQYVHKKTIDVVTDEED